jgi:carboxylate-amine ligase
MPYSFHNWQEYINLCRAIYRAESIQNLKDLWWDLRPSPRYGTLEIRICDQPATLMEGLAITAFVHGVALWFQEHQSWLEEMPRPNMWRLRENKWRAMRYGMKAELVRNNQGETRPISEDIELWTERFLPFVEHYNYQTYLDMLEKIMSRGNSAERQQRMWAKTHDLTAIARFNCDEFAAQSPLWERCESAGSAPADQERPTIMPKSAVG